MGNDFLFTRIKQGDEKALEKFTKENYLFFCALANRYVNDVQEAEDIVQEVLIRLWKTEGTIRTSPVYEVSYIL